MDPETWLYRAEEDWKCIRDLFVGPEKAWSVVAFHCQLASEKCLKAFLSFKTNDVPRTHDLIALSSQAMKFDPTLESVRDDCRYLTQFAIDARYPELDNEYDEALAHLARSAAERICAAIRERINL